MNPGVIIMDEKVRLCTKCSETSEHTVDYIRTTGSGISRFLNMQNKKFAAVSCSKCGYTEMYKQNAGGVMGNLFDIFTN